MAEKSYYSHGGLPGSGHDSWNHKCHEWAKDDISARGDGNPKKPVTGVQGVFAGFQPAAQQLSQPATPITAGPGGIGNAGGIAGAQLQAQQPQVAERIPTGNVKLEGVYGAPEILPGGYSHSHNQYSR